MNRSDIPAEVLRLIDELLHGVISDDGMKTLESALDNNREAQTFFRDYCQLHINLDAETRAQRVINGFKDRGTPATHHYSANRTALAGIEDSRSLRAYGGRLPQYTALGTASLVAVLGYLFFFGTTAKTGSQNLPKPESRQMASAERAIGPAPLPAKPIATIRLGDEEKRYIPLSDFGHLVLEGPAELQLVNQMRAKLNRGRIKVRIDDERGHGFTVETPHGEIKDLGTEFGVDVSSESANDVVVFEGAVNLSVPKSHGPAGERHVERLVQGEGLTFNTSGRLSRIMSIVTGENTTFDRGGEARVHRLDPIILNVTDNIADPEIRKFYEIVPGALSEDSLAYVDRPAHQWNGIDQSGMPAYLIGADYVKVFNDDKMRSDLTINVTLGRPARLFVFLDVRVQPPAWLQTEFRNTGDFIGLDNGRYYDSYLGTEIDPGSGTGPGNSLDEKFSVWERVIERPGGVIQLGPNAGGKWHTGMYGIAAVGLDPADASFRPKRELTQGK